jgi:dipeptidyl aminopeptidase/acylaminoacyl peptidase
VHAFAEDPAGRFAVIGSLTAPQPRSWNQPTLLIADGAWPRRKATNMDPDGRYSFGEGINSDQHPPRGGGEIPLAFSKDENAVFARVAREGTARLARIDLASGAVTELTPAHLEVVSGSSTTCGRRWALTLGAFGTPGDLYLFDAEAGGFKRLFGPNDALLATRPPREVEEFWYDSFDGQKIQGWIVKPPDFDASKKYPMVLEIHGGPHTAYGTGFFHEFQMLAAAGYVVLYTNPRGSTTYGSEFANVIQYRFPATTRRTCSPRWTQW